ncbi:hypothetical protein [Pseudopontixanthobacter vadosimaris]|uniref:hypothetical protein n=1 Tax=Pseudopontixanthobacter vadosimaris TaxID=2726450 RepID=UPI0014730EA6|nr:hypothetical protein [Pseudopontixanthobacter vadosimaris]
MSLIIGSSSRTGRSVSRIALAIALATGAAVGVTALEAPAYAQKKKKAEAGEAKNYSKGFIEAYQPIQQQIAAAGNAAGAAASVPVLKAAAQTPDDRFAAGQIIYSIGRDSENRALQREAVAMLIESGQLPAADAGRYNFLAGQLAYQDNDYPAARSYMEQAIAAGWTEGNPQTLIAESYFAEGNNQAGLQYLDRAIQARVDAGQAIDEGWLKRGLSIAYNSDMAPEAEKYSRMLVQYYPSTDNWGDAVGILRNNNAYGDEELLDLLRLSQRTNSLRTSRDYMDYIETADPRRLPIEVGRVIAQGKSAGLLNASDRYVTEAETMSRSGTKLVREDFASLEADARSPSGSPQVAIAAGDAYLSDNQAAKAEELYRIALAKPGVDTARALTRLGIAQLDQGNKAEANATFAKVEGARQAIARLWSTYAMQEATAVQ